MSQENVDPVGRPPKSGLRVATEPDLDGLTATLTGAFTNDPLWGWVFPDPHGLAVYWRFYLRSALRYSWVWVSGNYAAVAVWIPPGGSEKAAERNERSSRWGLSALIGPRAAVAMGLIGRFFEASHPRERPHYYLSLLWGRTPSNEDGGWEWRFSRRISNGSTLRDPRRTWNRPTRRTTVATSDWDSDRSASSQRLAVSARWGRCGARSALEPPGCRSRRCRRRPSAPARRSAVPPRNAPPMLSRRSGDFLANPRSLVLASPHCLLPLPQGND